MLPMTARVFLLVSAMAGAAAVSGWMILKAETEAARPAERRRRWLAARVLAVRRVDPLPEEFLESSFAKGFELVEVRAQLKHLPVGFHPADLVLDRINGGPGRIRMLRRGLEPAGQLWDYELLAPRGDRAAGPGFPRLEEASLALRFVVPFGFETALLDFRGRAVARVSL